MKHNYFGFPVFLLTVLFLMPCLAESCHIHDSDKVKYVQGGACEQGNGSKKHPFNSLEDAEAADWDVLMVLSSTIPLDGGINLKPGQKLIGEEDPTGVSLSPTQPTITNSSSLRNGGNGAVVHGDATIKNIYFKDTWAAGILYDDALNLTVRNVLITGHNQNGSDLGGAMTGFCGRPGKTDVEHVKFGGSFSRGINDVSINGAEREFLVCSSEFFDLAPGIITDALSQSTKKSTIRSCYIHDLRPGSFFGLGCGGFTGGHNTVRVEESVFFDVGHNASISVTSQNPNSSLKLTIDSTRIEQTIQDFNQPAIRFNTFDGTVGELTVKNCVSLNRDKFVDSFEGTSLTGNTQHITLCNNVVTGRVFYQPRGSDSLAQPASILKATIKHNVFNGTSAATGFSTRVIESFIDAALLHFALDVRDNCFFSANPGSAFYNNAGVQGTGSGAYIKARYNTISGFTIGIEDINANVNYFVSKNWWGPSSDLCSNSLNCTQYQTCSSGICRGPKVVQKQAGFTGIIDASNPLESSIRCPHSCCSNHLDDHNQPLYDEKASDQYRAQTLEEVQKDIEKLKSEVNLGR